MTPDPPVGTFVWCKYDPTAAGDEPIDGGMVVDVGITDKGERYVIALVGSPTYPPASHKRREWLYGRVEGKTNHVDHGQVAELRRFFLADLAPCDGFRDATKMLGFAAKALLAAGVCRNANDRAELLDAYRALSEAVIELRDEERVRDERAAMQEIVESGKRGAA